MVHSWEEDPLERHLDYDSDDEFGHPNLSHIESHTTDLSTWTAQDFAYIYTRFHPHLIRHARRYLSNSSQAEEVVQEAFLYLMTALPEIDSADGVLRFLKWKTKFLALDILRSKASKSESTGLPDQLEILDYESGFEDIERAEDAAVIQLALSKLSPRHRDVLIKSTYEELSIENIGQQLNIKPNAVRQLLYRARASFRKALVGEAELAGMTYSEILGTAVKKAARDAKQNAVKTSALLVLVGLGAGLWNQQLATNNTEMMSLETLSAPRGPAIGENPVDSSGMPTRVEEPTATFPVEQSKSEGDNTTVSETLEPPEMIDDEYLQSPLVPGEINSIDTEIKPAADFSAPLATVVYEAGIYSDSYSLKFSDVFEGTSIEVFGGTGISAFLDFKLENEPTIERVVFQVRDSSGVLYFGIPEEMSIVGADNTLTMTARKIHLVSRSNSVAQDNPFFEKSVEVVLQLDGRLSPASASMFTY